MLKKTLSLVLASLLALSALTACGGEPQESQSAAQEPVDLAAFYDTLFQGDDAPMMMELTDEYLPDTYPGLTDLELTQRVVYTASISAVACEVALVEVSDPEDVQTVRDIFQSRIDAQVDGGAWYPETVDIWTNNSEIVAQGNYVALFVAENKDDIVSQFNALFA